MRFIVFYVIIAFFCGDFFAASSSLPKTSITLNKQNGCAVHIAVWLSPSCHHCAEYFTRDLQKILAMPGFCLDLHSLPHLYLLDLPVAILIWSQGPDKAYKTAELFYKRQSEWLDISSSRENADDPRREADLKEFLAEVGNVRPNDLPRVEKYLEKKDPYLYVKIFALRYGFSIGHLEKYLPKGTVNGRLSQSLLSNLPIKDGKVINFSPAFTSVSGQLLPDSQLRNGILTAENAEDLLKMAGPAVPLPYADPRPMAQVPPKKPAHYIAKKALPKPSPRASYGEEGDEFQDADEIEEDEDHSTEIEEEVHGTDRRVRKIIDQLEEDDEDEHDEEEDLEEISAS